MKTRIAVSISALNLQQCASLVAVRLARRLFRATVAGSGAESATQVSVMDINPNDNLGAGCLSPARVTRPFPLQSDRQSPLRPPPSIRVMVCISYPKSYRHFCVRLCTKRSLRHQSFRIRYNTQLCTMCGGEYSCQRICRWSDATIASATQKTRFVL